MSYNNLEFSKMTTNDFEKIKNTLLIDFDDFWSIETLENELNSNNSYYIVAKEKDEIVGFAGIKFVLDEADIMNIVVKKDKRNIGIGYSMLEELLNIAKQKNIKLLTLEVSEKNLSAIHLYEKIGFKNIAVRKNYYKGTYDAYIMQMIIK